MVDQGHADAVIVGAGLAGLAAALRLREAGRSVRVLEARTEQLYPCNTRQSGGVFHLAFCSINAPLGELAEAARRRTSGFIAAELARALADNVAGAVAWLRSHDVAFTAMEAPEDWKHCVLAPLGFHEGTRLVWRDLGADRMMQAMERALERRGATVERGVRAVGLMMDDGTCRGVVARGDGREFEIPGESVVLASGGFQGDPGLLRRFVTDTPEALLQRGSGTGGGDGVHMAEAAGAALVGMDAFYGHILSADAEDAEKLCPFPFLDFVAEAGILVDADGRRFVDEGRGGVFMANAIARHAGGRPVFAVFDEPIWRGAGREFFCPPNPNLVEAGGTLHDAPTLAGLAARIGIDADALHAAVAAHNEALHGGNPARIRPERTNASGRARPIEIPPFRAAPGRAAITHTMGGIRIDEAARVRRPDGAPIPGLFAAGDVTGGFEGGPTIGYIGGLSTALVFGLIAADTISAEA